MENTKKSRADLKKYFAKNAMPTSSHFADVIDAALNQRDDGLAKPAGEPLSLEASATGSRTALRIYEAFADATPAWTVDLLDAASKKALVIGDGASARLAIDRTSGAVSVGALAVSGLLEASGGLTTPSLSVGGQVTTGAITAGGLVNANEGLTVASGKTLRVEGLTDLGVVRRRTAQFKVEGVKTSYYPVVFSDDGWSDGAFVLELSRANVHTDSGWEGSLVARFRLHETMFGHGSDFDEVEIHQSDSRRFIARYGVPPQAAMLVIWLRGGTTYFWRANHNASLIYNDARATTMGGQTLDVLDKIDESLDLARVIIGPAVASTTLRSNLTIRGLVTASEGLTVASGKTLTAGAITASGLTVASGTLSVGTTTTVARLDIAQAPRWAWNDVPHPTSVKGAYITGDFGPDSDGVEFRHSNGTQGIGFGYNTIYATGNNSDQDLALKPRGAGIIHVHGGLRVASGKTLTVDTLSASGATITVASEKTLATGAITASSITASATINANGGLSVGTLTGDTAPVITARLMPPEQGGSNERTELILFHGNDGTNGAGPDTITLRAPTIRLQTFSDASVSNIGSNAGSNDRLVIDPDGKVTIGSASDAPKVKLRVHGPSVANEWCGRITSGGDDDTVVLGALSGKAIIGAHNNALNAWAELHINGGNAGVHVGGLLKANQGLTVASDKMLTAGAITASGLTVASGTLSVGTATTVARLDIAQVPRSALNDIPHPTSIKGAYITGDFGPDSDGVEFRHSNGSQGVGFGYNTIYATGNVPDQDLGLKPRGSGVVKVFGKKLVASCVEVGGPGPTPESGQATIILHHHGVRGNQLRYNDGTLYLEAVTNGWATTTTPNLTVGGTVTAGMLSADTLTASGATITVASGKTLAAGAITASEGLTVASGKKVTIGSASDAPQVKLRVHSSTGGWCGRITSGGDGDTVVLGAVDGKAIIGAHNNALNEWASLYINEGGGEVSIGGLLKANQGLTVASETTLSTGVIGLNDKNIYFRSPTDTNHGLGWFAGAKKFADRTVDGPALFGHDGGFLGTTQGGQRVALEWFQNGSVKIAGDMIVAGTVTSHGAPLLSDRELKRDIEPFGPALERVRGLRAVRFAWKDPQRREGRDIGLIAQEVEEIFPEVVSVGPNGMRGVDYARLVAPLIAAVRELSDEVEALRRELDSSTRRD